MSETEIQEYLTRCRKKLHSEIDEIFERLQLSLIGKEKEESYELSLMMSPKQFKGLRPSAIIYSNGRKETVRTWRDAVEKLLKDCDAKMHDRLSAIVEDMQGRTRPIMAHTAEELKNPMRIGEGIYMESRYDTESLIHIMTKRIFNALDYEYSEIKIRIH